MFFCGRGPLTIRFHAPCGGITNPRGLVGLRQSELHRSDGQYAGLLRKHREPPACMLLCPKPLQLLATDRGQAPPVLQNPAVFFLFHGASSFYLLLRPNPNPNSTALTRRCLTLKLEGTCCPTAGGTYLGCCGANHVPSVSTGNSSSPEAPGGDERACSSHPGCASLGGDCCPAPDGTMLECCS